jgi:hypothetical protein
MLLGTLNIHMQKTEIRSLSFVLYKIISKLIKDLNVRLEALKLKDKTWEKYFKM